MPSGPVLEELLQQAGCPHWGCTGTEDVGYRCRRSPFFFSLFSSFLFFFFSSFFFFFPFLLFILVTMADTVRRCWMAEIDDDAPPIELTTRCARLDTAASRKRSRRPGRPRADHRMAAEVVMTPKPGISSDQDRRVLGEGGQHAAEVARQSVKPRSRRVQEHSSPHRTVTEPQGLANVASSAKHPSE